MRAEAAIAGVPIRQSWLMYRLDIGGRALTLLSIVFAVIWAFPLYWLVITTFKPEYEVVRPYIELWPDTFTFEAYVHIIKNTKIIHWYINS